MGRDRAVRRAIPPTCRRCRSSPDGWALGPPDLVLTMPEAWKSPARGFDMLSGLRLAGAAAIDDVTITGVEFQPGNRRIVHHSRIHMDETGDARRRERDRPDARASPAGRDARSWSCPIPAWADGRPA